MMKEPNFEKKEGRNELIENFSPDANITFMRHGEPEYTKEELEKCKFEGKLSEKGRAQVENSARELAKQIKENNEVAIIWSSRRGRADETSDILIETLKNEGVEIVSGSWNPDSEKNSTASLNAPDVNPEFWEHKPESEFFVRTWKEMREADTLPEGVETPEEAKKKFQRVLEYNRRIVELFKSKKQQDSPNLRIIDVAHFETVTPLLQEAYGGAAGIDKEYGLGDADFVNLEFQNVGDEGSVIKLDYEKGAAGGDTQESEAYVQFDKDRNLSRLE